MATKIRWGILSTAAIGRKRVIPAIQRSTNGMAAAVASRELSKAQTFAQEMKIPQAYARYEELLNDPNIDAVYIPLPNSDHAEWALRCAEVGKPVLCEKPLAGDAAQAQVMADTFALRKISLAEAFMYRFHPQTERVKEIIATGILGTIQSINASFSFRVQDEQNIRLSQSLGGGALMDVGCYCVNVMRYMFGEEPIEAKALGRFREVDERLVGLLGFPSGGLGHFECSLRSYRNQRYEIVGSAGRLSVDEAFNPDHNRPSIIHLWHGDTYQRIEIPPADAYQLMVEEFANGLLNGKAPRFAPQDAVYNLQVTDWLLLSAQI